MDGGALRLGTVWRRSGHASQTLVVLHLRAQGLGQEDEHPPTLSLWSMVNFIFTFDGVVITAEQGG